MKRLRLDSVKFRFVPTINYKNLDYEIETCLSNFKIGFSALSINYKNLDYEIETRQLPSPPVAGSITDQL